MKRTIAFCVALSCAAAVSSSAPAAETSPTSPRVKHHARHAPNHVVNRAIAPTGQAQNGASARPAPWLTGLFPNVKPYPPGQGNVDGLSREREDCNTGCIGAATIR